MTFQSPRSILIIQTAFIGDAVLATSLLEKLHHHYPYAKIDFLIRKGNEGLFKGHPFINKLMVWDKSKKKTRNLFSLLNVIRKNRYDLLLNCHRHSSSGILAGFSKAKYISGYKENPFSFLFHHTEKHLFGNGEHETERYVRLLSGLCDTEVFKPKLYPSEKDKSNISPFKAKPYIVMAPSSVWFTKQLPQLKWIELCNRIPFEMPIYLIGAENDMARCELIKSESHHPAIKVLAGTLTLLESCALMQDAKRCYVNDSGPLHFASAVNAPVTAFFCSTVPQFGFGPLSDDSIIIETNEKLNCRPCGRHGFKKCPKQHFKCGNNINISLA